MTRAEERGSALQIILGIIGGLILVGVVAAAVALWYVSHYVKVDVRETTPSGKQVEIETPFGDLKVRKAADVAQKLKLPVYPGAWPDEDSASVSFWAGTEEDKGGFDLTVAKYLTDDPLETVDAWYRQQLGPEFKRETGRVTRTRGDRARRRVRISADMGDGVAYMHERDGRVRGVGVERKHGRVKIGLFDVWEGREQ